MLTAPRGWRSAIVIELARADKSSLSTIRRFVNETFQHLPGLDIADGTRTGHMVSPTPHGRDVPRSRAVAKS